MEGEVGYGGRLAGAGGRHSGKFLGTWPDGVFSSSSGPSADARPGAWPRAEADDVGRIGG